MMFSKLRYSVPFRSSPKPASKWKLILLLILLLSSSVASQPARFFTAFDHEAITVAGTAIGFTASKIDAGINRAELATFCLETASIRHLADGNNPTATDGQLVNVGDCIAVYGYDNVNRWRAIRTGATSGTVNAQYYR